MAGDFPVDEAHIVALFMECISYGIYLVTLIICLRVLFWDQHSFKKTINWPMVIVASLMAIFSTIDVSLGLKHLLVAFIFYKGPGGPNEKFDDISYWVNVMKTVDTLVMGLIGDGMLIYRCYVVFSHSWLVIALPCLMWLADLACTIVVIYFSATLRQNALIGTQSLLKPFLYSFFSITLALNFLTTGMIIWRIWKYNKQSAPYVTRNYTASSKDRKPPTRLENAIRIILESGLLYSLTVIATFVCLITGSNALYPVSDVMVVVVGISFNLIIIRVDRSNNPSPSTSGSIGATSYPLRYVRSEGVGVASQRNMEIMISRDVAFNVSAAETDKRGEALGAGKSDAESWTTSA